MKEGVSRYFKSRRIISYIFKQTCTRNDSRLVTLWASLLSRAIHLSAALNLELVSFESVRNKMVGG